VRVEDLLKQLRREFIKVNILQAILDGLVFFLISNFVLFLLDISIFTNISNIYPITGLTIIFTGANLIYRARKYRLEIYEEKNPELQEILRTARDNLDRQNIVSQALFDELLEKSRKVTSESIIPTKQIVYKILGVGFLSFLTVMSGMTDFQLLQDGTELMEAPDQLKDIIDGNQSEDEFELEDAENIYGEPSDIDSSDMNIDFNISGTGEAEEGDLNPVQGPSQEELVLDVSGKSLNEDLELAKQYSVEAKRIG